MRKEETGEVDRPKTEMANQRRVFGLRSSTYDDGDDADDDGYFFSAKTRAGAVGENR